MAKTKSKYQIQEEQTIEEKALTLYTKIGMSSRKVSGILKAHGIKRSHMWVQRLVKRKGRQLPTKK